MEPDSPSKPDLKSYQKQNSICEMRHLKCLELTHCVQVEKLPEEISRLECLKELNILASGISHLPHSLYGLRGLRIIGDRWLLESCGLTPKRRRMSDEDFDFDDEMPNVPKHAAVESGCEVVSK
ncbi:Toll/interleukin-1 receptor domain-containing protein [Tanacetum coccineum]